MLPFKIRALLWYLKFKGISYDTMTPVQARKVVKKTRAKSEKLTAIPPLPVAHVEDKLVTMRDGQDIALRVYRPSDARNLPVIVYYHGGGFVINNIETHDGVCRILANKNQAVVVSVDYRLAPEYKFPIPHQDCYDATKWVAENAEKLEIDAEKLVVMGDSAGGNLAAVVALMAQQSQAFSIAAQVLIYPCTDGRLQHPSINKNGKGYLLTKDLMIWFMNHYKDSEEDILNPYFSPLLAEDLSNLPPAFVFTAQYDPLIDEGKAYADRLKEAGVDVVYKEYKGMIHAFFSFTKLTKSALQAQDDIQTFLARRLKVNSVVV